MSIEFDWNNPAHYQLVMRQRVENLKRLRADPSRLPALKDFYRNNIAQFVTDWGTVSDSRQALVDGGRPVILPFVPFPKQLEWLDWLQARIRSREPGLTEKSRDCGVTTLACAFAASACLFNRNVTILFGSAKEDKLDRSGDPETLLAKVRTFLQNLPREFLGSWDISQHSNHLRIVFPDTDSAIIGEAGNNIGRGGRSSVAFVDEAAHLQHPEQIDAALASNTECRIDLSSVSGMGNPFARKRFSGKISVFTFRWTDDPRKDQAWRQRQEDLLGPEITAGELELNYLASVHNQLIDPAHITAAIDVHKRLGIEPVGQRYGALDVADQGADRNAFAARHGILLQRLATWTGKQSDLYQTTLQAMAMCDDFDATWMFYDAVGVGSAVRGDSLNANGERQAAGKRIINVNPFIGSAAPLSGSLIQGQANEQVFANLKAHSWWSLRLRFRRTYLALQGVANVDLDDIISIDGSLPELNDLISELSQIQFRLTAAGRILIEKAPDGMASPNRADAVCMLYGPQTHSVDTWAKLGRDEPAPAAPRAFGHRATLGR